MVKELYGLNDVESLNSDQILEMYKKYLNSGFVKLISNMGYAKVFHKAHDCIVEDIDGVSYIDFLGGYGSINFGHSPTNVIKSLEKLSNKPNLVHNSLNPFTAVLAFNLAQLTGGSLTRSFFCNSGSEAVEGALKLVRAASGKKKIIFCKNSFHGKTFGALSVAGRENYTKRFEPLLSDCEMVEYGNVTDLEEKIKSKTAAAFIVEPIQGEGGVIVPPEGYFKQVRELCTKYDTWLIIDEIQTGFGRTGKMFAYEHEEITPDVLCLAKSLGGGIMPIGAYITSNDIYQKAYGRIEDCLLHTSTFGGNTYACTAAIAAIETIYNENLLQNAKEEGCYLLEKLGGIKNKYKLIKEVRGRGLLIGIEFNRKENQSLSCYNPDNLESIIEGNYALLVTAKLMNEYNILVGYSPSNPYIIRIEPPLIISHEHVVKFINALHKILEEFQDVIR